MDFLNIGGGELLVIVLLAVILFGPEDILKIMRTIGEYVRKIQQMWAQVSANLSGEFITDDIIPEDIRETIKETQESVTALKQTFAEIEATTKASLEESVAAVEEVETSLKEISASVATTVDEVPKALEATLNAPVAKQTPTTTTPDHPAPGAEPPVEIPHLTQDEDAPARTLETDTSEAQIAGASKDASSEADVPLTLPSTPVTSETHDHGEDS